MLHFNRDIVPSVFFMRDYFIHPYYRALRHSGAYRWRIIHARLYIYMHVSYRACSSIALYIISMLKRARSGLQRSGLRYQFYTVHDFTRKL